MQEIGSLVVILRDYNFKVRCEIIELAINNFYPRISTIRLPKTTITFRSQQKNQLLYYLGFFIMVKTVLIIITFKKHEKKTNVFVHPKSKTSLGNYKFALEASATQQPKSGGPKNEKVFG